MNRPKTFDLFVCIALFLCCEAAYSCPKINGLIDGNCDGKVQISIFGDSIVRGIRDSDLDKESGGYLKDLEKLFPQVIFVNGGIPGIDSGSLYRAFVRNAPNKGKTYNTLSESDAVLTGVGINDYWLDVPPQSTIRNILRTRDFIRSFGKKEFQISPFTLTINLTNTTRGFQEPWVKSVNALIRANVARLGPIVPFGNIPAALIVSEDRLHPDDAGYARLAGVLAYSLRHSYNALAQKRNVDLDKDGVADWAELRKFKTDPTLLDTDGDGISDGREIFKYKTNPLLVDSDGDGVDDATEIAVGTDPNPIVAPTSTATPVI
jgi:lysophospholipase L1-like esterase